MTRQEITRELVGRAVEVYFQLAYGTQPRKALLGDPDAGESVLRYFENESRAAEGEEATVERYTMRLGNRNYPFMKLVVQEHLVPGNFYFAVDCHDQLDIRPDFPDYEAWMKVKRSNLELKKQIEQAFEAAGLPTLGVIRRETILSAPKPREGRPMIFVVDDEEEEARNLEVVLRREGYDVALASDGREALERLPFLRPELVILDYEMPELDGLAVIRELRSQEATRTLPILLTTASQVLQKEKTSADGFLAKPFRAGELLRLVERLLTRH